VQTTTCQSGPLWHFDARCPRYLLWVDCFDKHSFQCIQSMLGEGAVEGLKYSNNIIYSLRIILFSNLNVTLPMNDWMPTNACHSSCRDAAHSLDISNSTSTRSKKFSCCPPINNIGIQLHITWSDKYLGIQKVRGTSCHNHPHCNYYSIVSQRSEALLRLATISAKYHWITISLQVTVWYHWPEIGKNISNDNKIPKGRSWFVGWEDKPYYLSNW
jgi:hypothetical protein